MANYEHTGPPQASFWTKTSSLISWSTQIVSIRVCSKIHRFLPFYMFQAVNIKADALVLRSFFGKPASSCCHHSAMETHGFGILIWSCIQSDTRCHNFFVKQHYRIKCSAVSCSWLQSEQIGSHGHRLLLRLSAVSNFDCTSNQAKNLCFPSASAL